MVMSGRLMSERSSIQVSREIRFWIKAVAMRRERDTGRRYTAEDVIRELLASRDDPEALLFPELTPDELNGLEPAQQEIPETAS